MSIGDRVKYLRKAKAMTQEALARKAGLGHNAISRIETDEAELSAKTLQAVSDALGVDTMDLYSEREKCFKMKLDPLAFPPRRAHEDDAGFDLFSPKYDYVPARGSCVIDTGVHIQIPKGFAGLIVSKSGLNIHQGILSDGLIDAGYTGSIRVKLYNMSDRSYEIRPKDKVSQIVFLQIVEPVLMQTDKLEETERGESGFGSTGR